MYRIKTKEEFIEEFGKGWRDKVSASFVSDMDYMLGVEITHQQYMRLQSGELAIDGWVYSKDMIKEDLPHLPFHDTEPKSLADCHGYDFEAEIKGIKVKGKISVESHDRIFLCQNKFDGSMTKNRFGHKYSWVFFDYDYEGLTIIPNKQSITNFKLLTKTIKDVKKDSKSKVCGFGSQGESRGTIITIHSKSVSPARGSRFVGRTATNFYTGTKANSGKISYNRIQSI